MFRLSTAKLTIYIKRGSMAPALIRGISSKKGLIQFLMLTGSLPLEEGGLPIKPKALLLQVRFYPIASSITSSLIISLTKKTKSQVLRKIEKTLVQSYYEL